MQVSFRTDYNLTLLSCFCAAVARRDLGIQRESSWEKVWSYLLTPLSGQLTSVLAWLSMWLSTLWSVALLRNLTT